MKTTLFTVGPVETYPEVLRVGAEQLPYFRTEKFSATVLECEAALRSLAGAPEGAKTALLTCSGSGAMEAAVINFLGEGERALIVRGGSFGERFCEICETHGIPYDALEVEAGRDLDYEALARLDLSRYRALFVNAHETSTGALYDVSRLGELCARAGLWFIVDGVSAFLCDPLHMERMHIDALIFSSQKALALPPGLSMILLSPRLAAALEERRPRSYYLDLRRHLLDMRRGQTPFTPAVGIILQLHERLKTLSALGADACVARCAALAAHFRRSIAGLPYRTFPERPSNALTALSPTDGRSAYDIFAELEKSRGLVVTPNGGALRDRVFRVGHMGNLSETDLDALALALKELSR
ncbi:MAG: aminotransferase class V-fold PLP-dependent enzyme [Treponema sp.]|nr:aminotransferase class V-fold PLP-dependent enzyme [Treponema sp.]